MPAKTSELQALFDDALAEKAAMRIQARAASWPEEIRIVERLRETTQNARKVMRRHKARSDRLG